MSPGGGTQAGAGIVKRGVNVPIQVENGAPVPVEIGQPPDKETQNIPILEILKQKNTKDKSTKSGSESKE